MMNLANRRVQEATYDVVLTAPSNAATEVGPDGKGYRVARAGGQDFIPDGAYLIDEKGVVRYRIQEGIGSDKAPAPQATLMSLVVKGILTRKLPWGFVLLGAFISILMEIVGVPALAFAVGVYLPLEITTPVFLGGLARRLVDLRRRTELESDAGPGVLYGSGLVAGGSLIGLASSLLVMPGLEKTAERLAFASGFLPAVAARVAAATEAWPSALRAAPRLLSDPAFIAFCLFLGVACLVYRAATADEKPA
jgi:hypothetical protein